MEATAAVLLKGHDVSVKLLLHNYVYAHEIVLPSALVREAFLQWSVVEYRDL